MCFLLLGMGPVILPGNNVGVSFQMPFFILPSCNYYGAARSCCSTPDLVTIPGSNIKQGCSINDQTVRLMDFCCENAYSWYVTLYPAQAENNVGMPFLDVRYSELHLCLPIICVSWTIILIDGSQTLVAYPNFKDTLLTNLHLLISLLE